MAKSRNYHYGKSAGPKEDPKAKEALKATLEKEKKMQSSKALDFTKRPDGVWELAA